jgi:hypothetical protein
METDFSSMAMEPDAAPIPRLRGRADTRSHIYGLKPGKPTQRLVHDEPLVLQLGRIRNMLKLTPAALSVMNAKRTGSIRRGRKNSLYGAPTDPLAARSDLDQCFIPGRAVGDEHYPAVHMTKAVTSGHYLLNSYLLRFHASS